MPATERKHREQKASGVLGGLSNRVHAAVPDIPLLRWLEWRLRHAAGMAANAVLDRRRGLESGPITDPDPLRRRYYDFDEDVVWQWGLVEKMRHFRERTVPESRREGKPRLVFLLESLARTGGVISVVQLANDLQSEGWSVALAVRTPHAADSSLNTQVPVYYYKDTPQLLADFPPADMVVATYWSTMFLAKELCLRRPALTPAFFVQDYEPLFIDVERPKLRAMVEACYRLPPHCFAKTEWICEHVRAAGGNIHRVPPAVDLDIFSPGTDNAPDVGKKVVLTMLRPSTPQRGFATANEVLSRLTTERADVEVHTFGGTTEEIAAHGAAFPAVHHGPLPNDALPALYRRAWLFAEFSEFHGFGRTIAEAMACATPCVITNSGGVDEFARDGKNCLTADPGDVEGLLRQLNRLLDNPALRTELSQACPAAIQPFSRQRSAQETADFLERCWKH